MADLACPVCGSSDIRMIRTEEQIRRVTGSASGDGKPMFIIETAPFEETTTEVVSCVNGHAHPARVGFDIEWV
jgi:hypothetical protein